MLSYNGFQFWYFQGGSDEHVKVSRYPSERCSRSFAQKYQLNMFQRSLKHIEGDNSCQLLSCKQNDKTIMSQSRKCWHQSLTEFLDDMHKSSRVENLIDRQENIHSRFTLNSLHTVLKSDETANWGKWKNGTFLNFFLKVTLLFSLTSKIY